MASFLKRRLGLAVSSMALGLDQVPELLLPAISMRTYAQLTAIDILMVVLFFFFVGELALSRVFFRLINDANLKLGWSSCLTSSSSAERHGVLNEDGRRVLFRSV